MEIINTPSKELIARWGHLLTITGKIFTWTSPGELARLAEYAFEAMNICEIGSYHGKSALIMAMANPHAQLTLIDNFDSSP